MTGERVHRLEPQRQRRAAPDTARTSPPRVEALLRAQAAQGNAYVARAVLARNPLAAPPKQYALDADGYLTLDGHRVGWGGGPPNYVCVDAQTGAVGVPFVDADIGQVMPGGRVLAVREATVDATDPANVKIKPKALTLGVRFDYGSSGFAEPLLRKNGSWRPIPYKNLDDELKAVLTSVPEAHISLTWGGFWSLMEFTLQGESKPRMEWAASKGDELTAARDKLHDQQAKLPTQNLKNQVDQYANIIAAVMAHEGSFDAKSPGSDYMASIGVFQWGMLKNSTDQSGASMVSFLGTLKQRATQPAAGIDAAELKLYTDAWAQVRTHQIDVNAAGEVIVHGHKATGAQIESALAGPGKEMGKGALRSYQLIAAADWIDEFKANAVRPGPSFPNWVGNHYGEKRTTPPGRKVTLMHAHGKRTYDFELDAPADAATVGSTFPTQKNVALAVTLGTNRPHWVEAALWRALTGRTDIRADVQAHLEAIAAAHAAAAPPAPHAHATRQTVTAADITAWGADAAYTALQRDIWPAARTLAPAEEEQMATDFKQAGLALYSHADAVRFERWRRFATVEEAYAP